MTAPPRRCRCGHPGEKGFKSVALRSALGPPSVQRPALGSYTTSWDANHEPANGKTVLSFDQAVTELRKLCHGEDAAEGPTKLITVDKVLRAYEADLRPGRRGYDA